MRLGPMADVAKLRSLIDAYGIAVRAGVITPCMEDEEEFRKRLGLKPMPQKVKNDWGKTGGIRRPITLQSTKETDTTPQPAESK